MALLGGARLGFLEPFLQLGPLRQQSVNRRTSIALCHSPKSRRELRVEGELLDRYLIPGRIAYDSIESRPVTCEDAGKDNGPMQECVLLRRSVGRGLKL